MVDIRFNNKIFPIHARMEWAQWANKNLKSFVNVYVWCVAFLYSPFLLLFIYCILWTVFSLLHSFNGDTRWHGHGAPTLLLYIALLHQQQQQQPASDITCKICPALHYIDICSVYRSVWRVRVVYSLIVLCSAYFVIPIILVNIRYVFYKKRNQ